MSIKMEFFSCARPDFYLIISACNLIINSDARHIDYMIAN